MLTGALEGALTDPDFLTKLPGEKKAIGWALFISCYFAKELYKAVHTYEDVRDGYSKQGYGVGEPHPKVQAGIDVIKDVQSGTLDPAAADAKLRELGNPGGLPDFIEKLSGQSAGFKWAKKS